MNAPSLSLADLQREMAAAVMQPLTADEEYARHRTRRPRMTAVAESLSRPTASLARLSGWKSTTGNTGFACSVHWRKIFRALRAVVGARAFEALSIAYLTAHPSRSFYAAQSRLETCRLAYRESARQPAAVIAWRLMWLGSSGHLLKLSTVPSARRLPSTRLLRSMRVRALPCNRICN